MQPVRRLDCPGHRVGFDSRHILGHNIALLFGQEPDRPEHTGAANGLDLLFRSVGVLQQVMKQSGDLMIRAVAPNPEDARHGDGVGDVRVAADARLPPVLLGGIGQRRVIARLFRCCHAFSSSNFRAL